MSMDIGLGGERVQLRRARFWGDFAHVFLRHPLRLLGLFLGLLLKADFRERIMLAVTQVNGCGLCAWAHTREALRAGIDRAEIRQMLAAEFDGVPEGQRTALLFAQHWTDTQGQPDAAAQAAFEAAHPPVERANIVFAIRTINTMNHMMLGLEGMLRGVGLARRQKS